MLFKGMGKDSDKKGDNADGESATKGARDEFEAIILVVKNDKILFQKIMDKIRRHRELSQKSILDLGKAQAEAKEIARKNRTQ